MNNKMITMPYAVAIEYAENTTALFKALWELTDLIRQESDLKKHHRAYLHVREAIDEKVKETRRIMTNVPFPVSWTVKMKKKQKETQDILSYHTQAAGCSDKARAKASGGRQPIEECGRTGL